MNEIELGAHLRSRRARAGLTQGRLAVRAGVSRAFVIDLERGRRPAPEDAIVVTRFDRRVDSSGSVARIHPEDLVQAFALDPRRKDEADGGPTCCAPPPGPDSVQGFARGVIAQQVLGVPDAHGKNHGLLLIGPRADLAPLYDVATGLIPDIVGRLRYPEGAMSIGGERGFGDVQRIRWEKFARALGVAPAQVVEWVDELTGSIPPAFERAAGETQAPAADFLADPVAANITAVARQSREGLVGTRRSGGRFRTSCLQTLPARAVQRVCRTPRCHDHHRRRASRPGPLLRAPGQVASKKVTGRTPTPWDSDSGGRGGRGGLQACSLDLRRRHEHRRGGEEGAVRVGEREWSAPR